MPLCCVMYFHIIPNCLNRNMPIKMVKHESADVKNTVASLIEAGVAEK